MPRAERGGLTARELRFCHEYQIDQNGAQAAIRAGYSARSARQLGHALLQRADVWAKVCELQDAALKRVQASADKVIAEWTNLGFSDPGKLVWMPGDLDEAGVPIPRERYGTRKLLHEMPAEVRRTIKSIEFIEVRGVQSVKLVLWDKNAPLTNLGKNKKLLNDTLDVNMKIGFADRLRAARDKRLKDSK